MKQSESLEFLDNFIKNMREPTEEERKSFNNYIESISKPTGKTFNDDMTGGDMGTTGFFEFIPPTE